MGFHQPLYGGYILNILSTKGPHNGYTRPLLRGNSWGPNIWDKFEGGHFLSLEALFYIIIVVIYGYMMGS